MAEVFVAKVAEFPDGERRIVSSGAHEIGVMWLAIFCRALLSNAAADLKPFARARRKSQASSSSPEYGFGRNRSC